ncbi:transferase family-domain-containing protein [Schizophyllum fasciatum]
MSGIADLEAPSVKITSQYALNCAHEDTTKNLPSVFRLGPFEQLAVPYLPVTVIFVYDIAQSGGEDLVSVSRLHQALDRLLDYYPHLTGRRCIDPLDGTTHIGRLGTGAALYTAECSSRLDAFRKDSPDGEARFAMSDLPGSGELLAAATGSTVEGTSQEPILTVQHTRFACGSVSLGVRLHHIVCDLNGFFQMMRDLSEIYRGIGAAEAAGGTYQDVTLKEVPCIQSHIPQGSEQELAASEELESYTEETSSLSSAKPVATNVASPPPVVGRILRFSGKELKALKEAATDKATGGWVSTFEALSAHLWQSVHRARTQLNPERADGDGETLDTCSDLLAPVNCRSRLNLPARYFSNAIVCPHARLPFRTLQHATLAEIAQTLHDMLQGVTASKVEGTLRRISAQGGTVKQRFRLGPDSFVVTPWNKVDMYGVYFDTDSEGRRISPVLVSAPFTPISLVDGLAFYLPTGVLSGHGLDPDPSIDVSLTLLETIWEVLDKDPNFRKFR